MRSIALVALVALVCIAHVSAWGPIGVFLSAIDRSIVSLVCSHFLPHRLRLPVACLASHSHTVSSRPRGRCRHCNEVSERGGNVATARHSQRRAGRGRPRSGLYWVDCARVVNRCIVRILDVIARPRCAIKLFGLHTALNKNHVFCPPRFSVHFELCCFGQTL